ncbi:MAG: hypothetical protein HY782_06600 [Chloroflexi bacterium]|nr:hypothetical protein [Chloroflexota bacterium]
MEAQIVREGLLLPKDYFESFGELEIIRTEHYILVKPKNLTEQMSGFVAPVADIATLHADYEDSLLTR